MLYEIDEQGVAKKREWAQYHLTEDTLWVALLTLEQAEQVANVLPLAPLIVKHCSRIDVTFHSELILESDVFYGNLTVVNPMHLEQNRKQCGIVLCRRYLLIVQTLDEDGMFRELLANAVKSCETKASPALVLGAFLTELLKGGNEALEHYEKQMVTMEQELVENRIDGSFNKEIFYMKKRLFVLKNYYEQLVDVGEHLLSYQEDVFKCRPQRALLRFVEKAKRLSQNTQDVREGLVHLREALDASLEYDLNRIMKLFTVVTTIFLPLSLIAGWYGMNFEFMPELSWRYGYAAVGGVSIAVVLICILVFRRFHLL